MLFRNDAIVVRFEVRRAAISSSVGDWACGDSVMKIEGTCGREGTEERRC